MELEYYIITWYYTQRHRAQGQDYHQNNGKFNDWANYNIMLEIVLFVVHLSKDIFANFYRYHFYHHNLLINMNAASFENDNWVWNTCYPMIYNILKKSTSNSNDVISWCVGAWGGWGGHMGLEKFTFSINVMC